jgi:hypothetical protein
VLSLCLVGLSAAAWFWSGRGDTTTIKPTGLLLERIDYSKPAAYGWTWGIQAGNHGFTDSYHQGTVFEAVTDPAGGTRKVAHIYLPASSTGRAAEGVFRRPIDLGKTDYYGLSVRVPAGWHTFAQNPNWHTLAAQLNYGGLGGPPVSLVVGRHTLEVMMLTGHVSANAAGGATGYEFQASPNQGTRLYLTQALPDATWVDVIVEVHWATTAKGWVDAWMRLPGGSWVRKVDTQTTFGKLVPTQQWGDVEGHSVAVNGIDSETGQPFVTADKAGLYAGPGARPLDFWESTFLRGASFGAVATELK